MPTPEQLAERIARIKATGAHELTAGEESPSAAKTYIPVRCDVCGTSLYATPEEVGEQLTCPDCHTGVTVPPLKTIPAEEEPPDEEPGASQEEYDLLDDQDDWASAPSAEQRYIGVKCSLCGTRLLATEDQVGTEIACPDCQHPAVVHAPSPAPAPPEPAIPRTEQYGTGDTPPAVDYGPYLEDVLARGQRRLEEEDRMAQEERQWELKPSRKPPPWLFRSGVISYLNEEEVRRRWLVLTLCLLGIWLMNLIAMILETWTAPPLSYLGVVIDTLGFAATLVCIPFLAPFWLAIVQHTVEGCDTLEDWEQPEWLDALFQCLYIILPFLFAGLPGALFARLAGLGPLATAILGHSSAVVLFPVTLLSAVEAGAPWGVFSAKILQAIPGTWRAWAVFYLKTTLLMGVFLALAVLAHTYAGMVGKGITIAFFLPVTIIYFRLLGRLGWFCADESVDESTPPLRKA